MQFSLARGTGTRGMRHDAMFFFANYVRSLHAFVGEAGGGAGHDGVLVSVIVSAAYVRFCLELRIFR